MAGCSRLFLSLTAMDLKWKLCLMFCIFQNVPVESGKYSLIIIPDLRGRDLNKWYEDHKEIRPRYAYPDAKSDMRTHKEASHTDNSGFDLPTEMIDDNDRKVHDVSFGIDTEKSPHIVTFDNNAEIIADKDNKAYDVSYGIDTQEEHDIVNFDNNVEIIGDNDDKTYDASYGIDIQEPPNINTFDYNVETTEDDDKKHSVLSLEKDIGDVYGEDKIVGGYEVDISSYPYHVGYGSNCAGAIIDTKWVITVGHCGFKWYIRAGTKHLSQGTRINVIEHEVHPEWYAENKSHVFDYDFQLLKLGTPLQYNSLIQPIKIARLEDMVVGKNMSVSGWGYTFEGGRYSPVLRAVQVPIISKKICDEVKFPFFDGLTPRMFCAGFKEGVKDACQGDSGGPAVSNDRLYGLVSFGFGCATPNAYGVYSNVAQVRNWIEDITGLKFD